MGELKGQLLSILLVLVVFGAIAFAIYEAYTNTSNKVVEKSNSELTTITTSSGKQPNLLSFKN